MKKNLLPKGAKIVSLIKISSTVAPDRRPQLLDYKNPVIKEIIPCYQQGGKYFDLQGAVVKRNPNFDWLEWPVSIGTVWQYPNGEQLLISRSIATQQFLILGKEQYTFNPITMVRYAVK